jgi:hypothetical protein
MSVGVGVDVAADAVGVYEATGAGVSNVAVAAAMTDDACGSTIERGQVVMTSQAPIPIKIRPASCLMRQRTIYLVCPLERTNTNAAPPAIKTRPVTHNSQLPFDAAVSGVGGNVDSETGVSEGDSAAICVGATTTGVGVSEGGTVAVITTEGSAVDTVGVAVFAERAGMIVAASVSRIGTAVVLSTTAGVIPTGCVGGTGVDVFLSVSFVGTCTGVGTLVRHGTVPPHPPWYCPDPAHAVGL